MILKRFLLIFSLFILNAFQISEAFSALKAEEQEQATVFKEYLEKNNMLIHDPLLEDTIQTMVARLYHFLPSSLVFPEILLIQDNQINALTTPLQMGINTGLILACDREDQLAGVMAHELIHHSQGHLERSKDYQENLTIPTVAAMAAALALSNVNPQAGLGALSLTTASSMQMQLNFSRDMEREADRLGAQLLQKAGYDPNGLAEFFKKLQKLDELNHVLENSPYLQTHPLTQDRFAELSQLPKKISRMTPSNIDFLYARERIRVLYSHDINLASFYKNLFTPFEKEDERYAWHYGYALVLIQKRLFTQASEQLNFLIKENKTSVYPWILGYELEKKQGNMQEALQWIEKALHQFSNHHALFLMAIQILHEHQKNKEAEVLLDQHPLDYAHIDEHYIFIASQIYLANQHIAQAYWCRAQYMKNLGDFRLAKQYLLLALKDKNISPFLKSKIHIELDQLKLKENYLH